MEKEMTQAERVRQSQLTIARGMKVLPESLKVLEDVRDWTAREWLYICALDGVDIKQLVNNSKGKLTVTYIKNAEMISLRVSMQPLKSCRRIWSRCREK